MSLEIHVFLHDSRVPTREAWQQAIDRFGFPLTLSPNFDPRRSRGFQPVNFKGRSTGYEFYLEPSTELLLVYSSIAPQAGDRDQCATFRMGGDPVELSAALGAAAVLTTLSEGLYFYPNDEILYTASNVVESIEKELNSL